MLKKLPLKPLDLVIILIAIILTCISALAVTIGSHTNMNVLVHSPVSEWVYPLNTEETITATGPLGNTVIRIHNNKAWVESSPCFNQVCVIAGFIHRHGSWVACLPNRIFLLVEGHHNEEDSPDVIAW